MPDYTRMRDVSVEAAIDLDGVVVGGVDRTGTYIIPLWPSAWGCFSYQSLNSTWPVLQGDIAFSFFVHKRPVGSPFASLNVTSDGGGVSDAIEVTLPLDCSGGDTFAFSLGGGTAVVTPL